MRRTLAALSLAAAACSGIPATGERDQPIIGGTTDHADPAVVLVIADNGQGQSLCTGEIVSPHVVLTAAHCVDPATVGNGNTFYIFLGDNINDNTQNIPANFVDAKETHYDLKFSPNNLGGGHDVGVVILSKAVNIAPLPMNKTPLGNNFVGTPLRIVGYGVSSGQDVNGTTAGTKRQTTTPATDIDNSFVYLGNAQKDTCEGDSGGPAFATLNNQEVIVGITSFGDQGCVQGGADTRVDVWAIPFVTPYIMQFDGQMQQPPPDMAGPADMTQPHQNPPPDMTQPHQNPGVDMAQPHQNHDLGFGGNADGGAGALGAVGDPCHVHDDCQSHLCAISNGPTGFCTQPCDPSQMGACPAGLVCGPIGNDYYCIPGGHAGGGCSVAKDAPPSPLAAWVLLGLLGAGVLHRRGITRRPRR